MATKIDAATPQLKAKLHEAIKAWVRETLENSPVSRSSFLEPPAFETHLFRKVFRRKMLNANIWEPMQAMLADERIDQLVLQAVKRHERAAFHDAQLVLPGFENSNLPQKIRTGRRSLPLNQVSVGQYLVFADRYEKRATKNEAVGAEVLKLAGLIREQPAQLSVPEALARVTGSGTERAAKAK